MNPFKGPFKHLCRRLRRNDEGAILVELALTAPLFALFIVGTVELGNYLLLNLKLQHTVVAIADLVTRDEEISEDTLTDIFTAVPQIMAPYETGGTTRTIITSISQAESVPASIYWQRLSGTLNSVSSFGAEGESAVLPGGLTLRNDETILATEVFYSYEPLIFDFLSARTLRKVAYFRPRIGALQAIQ